MTIDGSKGTSWSDIEITIDYYRLWMGIHWERGRPFYRVFGGKLSSNICRSVEYNHISGCFQVNSQIFLQFWFDENMQLPSLLTLISHVFIMTIDKDFIDSRNMETERTLPLYRLFASWLQVCKTTPCVCYLGQHWWFFTVQRICRHGTAWKIQVRLNHSLVKNLLPTASIASR